MKFLMLHEFPCSSGSGKLILGPGLGHFPIMQKVFSLAPLEPDRSQTTWGKSLGRYELTAMATAIHRPEDKTCFILLFCTKGSRDARDKWLLRVRDIAAYFFSLLCGLYLNCFNAHWSFCVTQNLKFSLATETG